MPRTKPQPERLPVAVPAGPTNGLTGEVLTLTEAAAYLRLPEAEVLRLVKEQALPARPVGTEWRLLKAAINQWLSTPAPKYSKEGQMAVAGLLKDDPDLVPLVEEIYRQRGRPITDDGSYNLLDGLEPGGGQK